MLERITVNLAGTVRSETIDGREYLIAPVSLIVPGVLNGSNGPLFYPEDEVVRSIEAWNGVPLVVTHPTANGVPISARTNPDLAIGEIRNARSNGKLVAEGWFDVERTKRIDPRVYYSLSANRPMELSTGLTLDQVPEPGQHNGRSYIAVARNYRPDHVAILPDEVGACSLRDGCGLLVNRKGTTMLIKVLSDPIEWEEAEPLTANKSLDDIRDSLSEQLANERFGGPNEMRYLVEVYSDSFVYSKNGKLWKLRYVVKDEILTILDSPPVEVQLYKEYREVPGEPNVAQVVEPEPVMNLDKGGTTMPKKEELIGSIIAGCDCWAEDDRPTLNALSEDKLEAIATHVELHNELVANAAKPAPPPASPVKKTAEEWWQEAPPEVRGVVNRAVAWENDQRKQCIEVITANERNKFTEDQLKAMPLDQLQGIVSLLDVPGKEEPQSFPMFLGAAAPVANAQPKGAPKEEPLMLPKMDYSNVG